MPDPLVNGFHQPEHRICQGSRYNRTCPSGYRECFYYEPADIWLCRKCWRRRCWIAAMAKYDGHRQG